MGPRRRSLRALLGLALAGALLSACAGDPGADASPPGPTPSVAPLGLTLDALGTPTTELAGPGVARPATPGASPALTPTAGGGPALPSTTWPITVPRVVVPTTPVTLVRTDVGSPMILAPRSEIAGRTGCTSVIHIGDSTSVGMVSPLVVPDQSKRLEAQYARIGVFDVHIDALGGRAVKETRLAGEVSGYDAALAARAAGFHGCWVFALGTNDAANVGLGSGPGPRARIELLLSVAGTDPALFVDVRTTTFIGDYAEPYMVQWNAALSEAAAFHPNMRIYAWSAEAHDDWYLADGVHYTPQGYAERAARIADALATAFPA